MGPASKMYEAGSEAYKEYALNHVLPPHIAYAHRRGLLHQHDLNYYLNTYNCLTIPLRKMLANGLQMPHGYLRRPNRFMSACAMSAVAIQSVQN